MESEMSGKHVAIIGAAIAGPSAAFNLARKGYGITVIETRPQSDLVSAGILGITHSNWRDMVNAGIPVTERELDNGFRAYGEERTESPFRYITWTGLHEALVNASRDYGVIYEFEHTVNPADMLKYHDYVVEATGVAGAARINLPHVYSGYTIYRGLSPIPVGEPFITYHGNAREYFTIGDTSEGSFWAMFIRRPMPAKYTTTITTIPPREYRRLPAEFHPIIESTPEIFRSPLSDWHVPEHMHDWSGRLVTIGDRNGPVRPVTTSGANLAWMEGMSVDMLLEPRAGTVGLVEGQMLYRRQYDLELGRELEGPEIGGTAQDTMYALHHANLFGTDYA